MRILQVNKLYHPHVGGVERVVRLLAEGLARRDDIESGVLVCNEGPRTKRERLGGVEVTRVGSLGRAWSEPLAPAFPWRLRHSDADIHHFHSPFPLGEASALALKRNAVMVTWYHSDVVRQKPFLRPYRRMLGAFLARNRAVLVSSPNLAATSPVLRDFSSSCRVVHFGIDPNRFEAGERIGRVAAQIRESCGGGGPLVLFVGRLVYYKGLHCLLEAMEKVRAHLLVIGNGPLRRELARRAEKAGMAGRIHFKAWVEDEELPAYYHACDMLVLPSVARTEAFGLVLLEAQACGKPTVSTELGTGTSYANLDGVTGFVVPPGDSSSLASAINRLLESEALRDEMGARARERVRSEFGIDAMVEKVAEIYAEVLEGRAI